MNDLEMNLESSIDIASLYKQFKTDSDYLAHFRTCVCCHNSDKNGSWLLYCKLKPENGNRYGNYFNKISFTDKKIHHPYGKLFVVTRVHKNKASNLPAIEKVLNFISNSRQYAEKILIFIGTPDHIEASQYIHAIKKRLTDNKNLNSSSSNVDSVLIFLHIDPWGYFTTALNSAIQAAQDDRFELIVFQSLEYQINQQYVDVLSSYIVSHTNVLVIGMEMDGHNFTEGSHSITGTTCPWNTFAIWRVNQLALTGFLLIADGTASDRSIGGVEELTAISLHQILKPNTSRAVLVKIIQDTQSEASSIKVSNVYKPTKIASIFQVLSWNSIRSDETLLEKEKQSEKLFESTGTLPSIVNDSSKVKDQPPVWATKFQDHQRSEYHNQKMASKNDRPAQQMELLGIKPGTVEHIVFKI